MAMVLVHAERDVCRVEREQYQQLAVVSCNTRAGGETWWILLWTIERPVRANDTDNSHHTRNVCYMDVRSTSRVLVLVEQSVLCEAAAVKNLL